MQERSYLQFGPEYQEADLLTIAQSHYRIYLNAQEKLDRRIILDTFLLNIAVWSEFKYNRCHPWILDKISQLRIDQTFLMKPNIPWEPDILRNNPNDRMTLFDIFKSKLEELEWDFKIIDKLNDERLKQCLSFLNH